MGGVLRDYDGYHKSKMAARQYPTSLIVLNATTGGAPKQPGPILDQTDISYYILTKSTKIIILHF